MASLFEEFVVNWLQRNGPKGICFAKQVRSNVTDMSGEKHLSVLVDILARRGAGGPVIAVLDTKYKIAENISNSDVFQIQAYASFHRCSEAILIHPQNVRCVLGEIPEFVVWDFHSKVIWRCPEETSLPS